MSDFKLKESLKIVDGTLASRTKMASIITKNPGEIPALLRIAFLDEFPVSSKACWVLEVMARDHLNILLPYLNQLIPNLDKATLDSSVRPLAKICENLTLAYFQKKDPQVMSWLTDAHLEKMTAACFDWLISEQKVAPKAYAMTCLYHLGSKFPWVHPELRQVLELNYQRGSAAYQARAKLVLQQLPKGL
ncbi:MAG: adenylosuccinate lyase [Eudoraea sp.]|nr:adenylosuccinate lyase [Eudoraea sp.]NNJ39923.1 adenylosuccinate lyase [Eudoraea sp.]